MELKVKRANLRLKENSFVICTSSYKFSVDLSNEVTNNQGFIVIALGKIAQYSLVVLTV